MPAAAQSLTGAGATFPNPIYTKWFDAYNKKTGIQINYQSIGSGGGIRQFTEGTVDFGATDGPMNESQIQAVSGQRPPRAGRARRRGCDLQPPYPGRYQAQVRRQSAGRHLHGPGDQVERPEDRRAQPGREAAGYRPHRGASLRRLGHDLCVHRLPQQVLPGVEGQGRLRHVGELAGRARRKGKRGGHPAGQAGRGSARLRRADLRLLQQAPLRPDQERTGQLQSPRLWNRSVPPRPA